MKSFFVDVGYKVYAFNPGKTTHKKIEDIARDLAAYIEEVTKRESVPGIYIVAHRMGGSVARHCLEECGQAGHILKLFSLGTPYAGTNIAFLALHTVAARESVPDAVFIQILAEKRRYISMIVSIRGRRDQLIKPKSSSVLDGAVNIEIDVVGHNLLKDEKIVADVILKYLILAKR